MAVTTLGSDVPEPDPLTEEPPPDRYCDLVLNGGVASGVVYPWALVELARHYRFKSIGGNSVGAIAAAVAAAAEYGRCRGVADAFEPLRRIPLVLAEEDGARRARMLRLFQPAPCLRRLFDLFLAGVRATEPGSSGGLGFAAAAMRLYGLWGPLLATVALAALGAWWARGPGVLSLAPLALAGALALTLVVALCRLHRDVRALARHHYGLCPGTSRVPGEEALVEWLHRGIQLSAGRQREDAPLTFADLWAAPRAGRRGPAPAAGGLQPPGPGIELQMFSSNVTLGRPLRLPLNDANTRLFYRASEWAAFFPAPVLRALRRASLRYRPASGSDPGPHLKGLTQAERKRMAQLRELPGGAMPIVVAARLSLCFPFLFSSVPVYAIDYEAPAPERRLRRCLLSDGGLCTNFPVHLFDAACPRWPTFGFLLDRRLRAYQHESIWLPQTHLDGRADNWQRGVPGADDGPAPPPLRGLIGLVGGMLLTMKDWNDRVTGRLPQVRTRVLRIALRDGEGQLNIAMPGTRLLRMAHEYGTLAGRAFVQRWAPSGGAASRAWREHLYVRTQTELRALQRHLRGFTGAAEAVGGDSVALAALLDAATHERPLAQRPDRPDASGGMLDARERDALRRALTAVQALESELASCEAAFGPYRPLPEPELRLRPPL